MDDKPNFDGAKEELAKRDHDTLNVGDVVQEWRFKRTGTRGGYRWIDGDVLAVVMTPCIGMDWVTMIQWRDGDKVLDWTTLTSLTWRESILFRRAPT